MGELRRICRAHKLQTGRHGAQLFLGREPTLPFVPSTVRARALKAWKGAGLAPLTAHEARHCAASYMIACGLDWKKISEFLGHTDAAAKLDAYFDGHRSQAESRPRAGGKIGDSMSGFRPPPPAPSG
jgi:integrase